MDENPEMSPIPVLFIITISTVIGLLFGGIVAAGVASVFGLAIYSMTVREVEDGSDR